jgi:hypothetical protein
MTRIMRDSTTATDIPVQGTELVAGYIDGKFEWTAADYRRFPGVPHVFVDISGSHPNAGVLDVEPGCAPVDAVKRGRAQHPDGSWAEPPGPAVTEGHFDESLVYDDEWHHNP